MFEYNIKIYYEDTDSGGVVYYANYLKFTERARTDLIQQLGFSLNKLSIDYDILFVVKKIECEYQMSAKLEDDLIVKTKILEIKNASFTLQQDIERNGITLFTSKILMVCINSKGKPNKIPKALSQKLQIHV